MSKLNQLTSAINEQAANVVATLGELDVAAGKAADGIKTAMQTMVDAAAASGLKKDKAAVTAFGKLVREAEAFLDAVAEGMLEQKTVTEYAQGAMRAFFHGVEWSPRLKNDSEMALPWGKTAKGGTATPAGSVKSTDRAALDATACKFLQQARLLGLTELAADVLDLLIDRLDGFKEPADAAM